VSDQHHSSEAFVAQSETSADDRLHPEDFKEFGADPHGPHSLGFAAPGEVYLFGAHRRETLERAVP
jgi:hypothetical protein